LSVTQDRNPQLDVLPLSTPDKTSGKNFCKQQTAVIVLCRILHTHVKTRYKRQADPQLGHVPNNDPLNPAPRMLWVCDADRPGVISQPDALHKLN